jgi:signal transduction histidine kinase
MQSLVEEQDATNEELQSANEEILSANEELHSTNEELQTAKEELQSANEELSTINEQLQHRNLELNQSTNDLMNLLASTTIPVIMVGSDLRIRRVTPPARKVMNLMPSDVGRSITDFKSNVDVPDLEAMIGNAIEHVHVQAQDVQDCDGRWYSLRVHPYRTADNKIDGAAIVLVDIDQVKRTEEEARASRIQLAAEVAGLERLYELTRSLMVAENLQTSLERLLEASIAIVGADMGNVQLYNPLNGALELFAQRGFRQDFVDHFLAVTRGDGTACGRAMASGKRVIIEDVEADAAFAPYRAMASSAGFRAVQSTPLLGRGGVLLAMLSTHFRQPHRPSDRDLRMLDLYAQLASNFIERVRAEEALKDADRHKNEFMATLAHELRNPLAPIRNAVQFIALSDSDPTDQAEVTDILNRQTQHLMRIVDDLLDMSRIIQGKFDLRKERVTLATVVTTAVESTRSFVESRRHRLTVNLPAEPLFLEADPVRLAQVLINLLNNAAKFTDVGGQISLTAMRDAAAQQAVISVRDNGDGIAADVLPRIFTMFTQGDRSLERTRGGLGVGLTLVQSLVQLHGGTVEAQSEGPGRGSEFTVRLPLGAPDHVSAPAATVKEVGPGNNRARRVLVVDDNEDQVQSLALLLKLLGHQVESARDAAGAVATAKAFAPDLALVDIGLPVVNGYEVARQIRKLPGLEKIVLVAQTGWGQEEDRRRSHEAGFDQHLVKPVEIERVQELLSAIQDGQ